MKAGNFLQQIIISGEVYAWQICSFLRRGDQRFAAGAHPDYVMLSPQIHDISRRILHGLSPSATLCGVEPLSPPKYPPP